MSENKTKIVTDHKWKNFLYGYELTEKEKKEFDYMSEQEIEYGNFFRYCGQVYSLFEFLVTMPEELKASGWHGFASDSYFSGIAVKVSNDCEQYMVATVIS